MVRAAPTTRLRWRDSTRLIPSRYPSVGVFDRVTSPADLEAVLELESWTNDRLNTELGVLHLLPRDEWVVGVPMASVIMAAFCHPHPLGTRFSTPERGAWYGARAVETSIAESAYHRWREFQEIGVADARVVARLYRADFNASFHDVRHDPAFRPLLDPDSYRASQEFGAQVLAAGSNGVVYPSVRDPGGECLACFRPRLVQHVRAASHYEFRWEGLPIPRIRRLS
jgi:RES domain